MLQVLFMILLFVTALFLILLVLVQRGRGGGLAGALGGMGGQSAFGTKAGDLFTRITIGVAAVWIILCASVAWYLGHSRHVISSKFGKAGTEVTAPKGDEKPSAPASQTAPAADPKATAPAAAAPASAPAATPAAPVAPGGKK